MLASGEDWDILAKAAMAGEITFDHDRSMLYLHSCSSDQIVGQVPLSRSASVRIAATIEAQRQSLLLAALTQM